MSGRRGYGGHRDTPSTGNATAEAFRRLGAVEHDQTVIREQLAGVSAEQRHQGQQLSTIEQSLAGISQTLQARAVTDWKSLAAWAGVILAVVGAYTTLTMNPVKERQTLDGARVERLEEFQRGTLAELTDLAEKRGRYLEKVDGLERRINAEASGCP